MLPPVSAAPLGPPRLAPQGSTRGGAAGLLAAGVLLLLALRAPSLAHSLVRNQVAIAGVAACGQPPLLALDPAPAGRAAPDQGAWLAFAQARCRGDSAAVRAAGHDLLATAATRLDLVRVVAPTDSDLADFAARRYPDQAAAQFWLGDARAAHNDPPGAIAAYVRGLAIQPADAETWMALGHLYAAQGDEAATAKAYGQACYYVDHGKNGCLLAGQLDLKLGQYAPAAEAYRRVLQQLGTAPAYEQGLVTALLALGRTDEAIPYLRSLAAGGSTDAQQTLDRLQRAGAPAP
ncbi:MAG TPA: tetratricopeptide repeat protein [Chloroflexia bacterium]|nr:tetratricopeptide repeat protein [Chloroflexia bacterium]